MRAIEIVVRGMLALVLAARAPAQPQASVCNAPAAARSATPSLFDETTAGYLGDIAAEHNESVNRVLSEPALTAELERIGERVRMYLPNGSTKATYFLSDSPQVNAFTFIGGRIYVTRRMIAFVRSEDELAGILAHEIAHLANRDVEVDISRRLRALGVTRLNDRDDVIDKYDLLLDSVLKPGASQTEEEKEQIDADRMAVHALTRAGYRPGAFAEFWDRFAETRGKTGSRLSRLFGTNPPEMKRLREALRAQGPLPANCVSTIPVDADAFARWRQAVASFEPGKGSTDPAGLIFKKALESPLQPVVGRLRFSPDGRWILAHDASGITVFDRDPFAALFRIDADDAVDPEFTPDSASIVFRTPTLRIEKWEIATRERTFQSEIVRGQGCAVSQLSPDGSLLACFSADGSMLLLDAASGAEIFRKGGFAPDFVVAGRAGLQTLSLANLLFSPDGRYFLAWSAGRDALGYDIRARSIISVGGNIREILRTGFGAGFLGPNQIGGIDEDLGRRRLTVLTFPEGGKVTRTPLTPNSLGGAITAAASGDALQMRPAFPNAVALLDPATGKVLVASKSPALDAYKDVIVSEIGNGQIELRRLSPGAASAQIAVTNLLSGPLGAVTAAAVSPDLKWLALSQRQRGGVWNLETRQRVTQLREFQAALIEPDPPVLYADFPAVRNEPRTLGKVDLSAVKIADARVIDNSVSAFQVGPTVLTMRRNPSNPLVMSGIDVSDVRNNAKLWSREFGKGAAFIIPLASGDLVFAWPTSVPENKAELSRSTLLTTRLNEATRKEGEFLLEVASASSGEVLGAVLHTGPLGLLSIQRAYAIGGTLGIEDPQGRVFLYSIASGKRIQRLFATQSTLSPSGRRLAAQNQPGRIAIYDVASARKEREILLLKTAAVAVFADERRLLIVTLDQTAYLIDLTQTAPAN